MQRATSRGHIHSADVLALQRVVGNQGTTAMLAGLRNRTAPVPVQRNGEDDLDAVLGGTSTFLDVTGVGVGGPQSLVTENFIQSAGAVVADPAGMGITQGQAGQAQYTTNVDEATRAGGPALGALGTATAVAGLGLASKRHHRARVRLASLRRAGVADSSPQMQAAVRDVKMSGADVAEKTAGTAGSATGLAAASTLTHAVATNAGSLYHASAATAAAGGFITTPLAATQAVRQTRKAYKANRRVKNLLATAQAQRDAALTEAQNHAAVSTALKQELDTLQEGRRQLLAKMTTAEQVMAYQGPLARVDQAIAAKQQEIGQANDTFKAMVDALKRSRDDARAGNEPSLLDIQAYAYKKNQRGVLKKMVNAYAGLVGTAAGVATTVAAIALAAGAASGAAVLMATPVGWGLAAAAAAVGLGMFTYSLVRGWKKRFERARKADPALTKWQAFRKAAAFWKSVGPSRREVYADKLIEYATTHDDRFIREQAKQTIVALGIDPSTLGNVSTRPNVLSGPDREALKGLIAEKMKS